MFEEFLDLPLHPLAVHLPIVLIPLLIMVALAYALIPPVRRLTWWALIGLAVVAPAVTWATRESGYELRARLAEQDALPAPLAEDVDEHARLSHILIWLVAALAVVSLMLVLAVWRRANSPGDAVGRADESDAVPTDGQAAGLSAAKVVVIGSAVAVVGLSAAAGYYLFETGDLGARMVWEGR